MGKSYSKFTFDDLSEIGLDFGYKTINFSNRMIEPSDLLIQTLKISERLPLGTETSKSQLITAPVLNEILKINNFEITYYAGYTFDVDKELGLKGMCDFIISKNPNKPIIDAPVFCVVEAKKDNVDEGLAQCSAEMYAAQKFNIKKGKPVTTIYGAVSSGFEWLFLRLDDSFVSFDTKRYYLNNLPQLLGVLQDVIDFYK
jgi:hypothetical protein